MKRQNWSLLNFWTPPPSASLSWPPTPSNSVMDVNSNSAEPWWRRWSRSSKASIDNSYLQNPLKSQPCYLSMPDAIPEQDRVYAANKFFTIESQSENHLGSSTASPNENHHIYQNYPTPDLLDATFNSDYDSDGCQSHCACGGHGSPEPNSPSDLTPNETNPTVGEALFGFMNKSKSVSFRKQKLSNVINVPQAHEPIYCSNCTCYLDPVKLNDNVIYEGVLPQFHEYQNTRELILAVFQQSQLLNSNLNLPSTNDMATNDRSQTNAGRNKLNLTIDTHCKRNGYFYDPMYDFILNTPVIKKLRELGFKYPSHNEIKRSRLLYATIAALITIIILLIVLNVVVPNLLMNQTSKESKTIPFLNTNLTVNYESNKNSVVFTDDIQQSTKLTTIDRLPTNQNLFTEIISDNERSVAVTSISSTNFSFSTENVHEQAENSFNNHSELNITSQDQEVTVSGTVQQSTTLVPVTTKLTTKKPSVSTWLPTFPANIECQKDQFKCMSGVSRVPCLYKWERCDGIQDCSDGSDEIFCGPDALNCYGNFICDDGSCVSLAKVCNGVFDCNDGSDEMKCDNFTCQSYEYRCPSGYCIPHEWTCDGEVDCPDHREEYNCSTKCPNDKFLCDEGWCIPNDWRCNGVQDCTFGEDESNCSCSSAEFSCKSGGCIDTGKICDGIAHCSDGSDEHDCVKIDKSILIVREPGRHTYLPVCSLDWSKNHADLICKQLGFSKSTYSKEIDLFKGNFSEVFITKYKSLPPISIDRAQFILSKKPLSECKSKKLVKLECKEFDCGLWSDQRTRHKRIVGGQASAIHEWPSVGILFHPQKKWACTASILAPHWVVTSALCVRRTDPSPFDWKLIIGSAEPTETNPDMVVRSVKKFVQHPSYKFKTLIADYDVMLVQLDEPLDLNRTSNEVKDDIYASHSDHISAICAPQVPTEPGSWCVTAGWGYTTPGGFFINKQLKHLEMGVWLKTICNGTAHYPGLITDRMVCAGNDESEWGPCFNDEGAPLMCHSSRTNRWYLAGVLTSQNCGSMKHPSVYADIYSLKDWIEDTVGIF